MSYEDELQARNQALTNALNRASKELAKVRSQVAQLSEPPLTPVVMIRRVSVHLDEHGIRHAKVEVAHSGRTIIVAVSSEVDSYRLKPGDVLLLNDNMIIVGLYDQRQTGRIMTVDQILDDARVVVSDAHGQRRVVLVAPHVSFSDAHTAMPSAASGSAQSTQPQVALGAHVLLDASERVAIELIDDNHAQELVLEETPNVSFEDIGGLDAPIEVIRDSVQLPFMYRALYERFEVSAPKGVLLYGPPGNGKTMIAKAIARSLSNDHTGTFLSVKGPELLNKYVGESERLVRVIFQKARACAASGNPVIVFIDEMDSLLRTRGSGVSSDVETTIVPQFLSELDGIDQIHNVIVIGASNRIDMIDPAVLRPGRLDVKIRIDRPSRESAFAIASHYLTNQLPYAQGYTSKSLSHELVDLAFAKDETRVLCEVCGEDGLWRHLYFADVMSGAIIRNMVDRVKTQAVKASIIEQRDIAIDRLMIECAVSLEFEQTRDAMREVNVEQWARTNGIAATRIRPIVA